MDGLSVIQNNFLVGRFRKEIIQKNMGICSLSETNSSIVMWRYYADDHRGFCMEYDLIAMKTNQNQFLEYLFPVIYTEKLPDMTYYFTIEEGRLNNLFGIIASIHKSQEWSFEKEWRVIAPLGNDFCSFAFPLLKPKAIYLGIDISEENKKLLKEIAKENNISVFHMKFVSSSFDLKSVVEN